MHNPVSVGYDGHALTHLIGSKPLLLEPKTIQRNTELINLNKRSSLENNINEQKSMIVSSDLALKGLF